MPSTAQDPTEDGSEDPDTMSTQDTERTEPVETRERTETDRRSGAGRFRSTAGLPDLRGAIAALAGGALLAGAVRSASRRERRAGLLALVGGALLAAGLRRLRSADRSTARGEWKPDHAGVGPSAGVEDEGGTSAEARAHRDRSDVMQQSEADPRGVSGEPDVETGTDPGAGDVRFAAERDEEPEPKPDLEGATADDPRRPDASEPGTPDDHVEVDLSEAAMADEASEATGPDPEQAYPAREGTDPEPTSPAAPDQEAEESKAGADAEPDDGDEGTREGTRTSEDEPDDGDEDAP